MDLAAQQPLPRPAPQSRGLSRATAFTVTAAVAATAGLALAAATLAASPAPGTLAVHRLQLGPAGVEYYGSALGERVADAYLDLGRGVPFNYAKAGPFFIVVSSSDGTLGRVTLGTDFA